MIEKRIVKVNGSLSNEKRRKCEGNVNNELQRSSYGGVIYHTYTRLEARKHRTGLCGGDDLPAHFGAPRIGPGAADLGRIWPKKGLACRAEAAETVGLAGAGGPEIRRRGDRCQLLANNAGARICTRYISRPRHGR